MDVDTAGTAEGDNINLCCRWSGSQYSVSVPKNSSVAALKDAIYEKTHVLPKRQKIIGLFKGSRIPADETVLSEDAIHKTSFMLVGTMEQDIPPDVCEDTTVVNDLDFDFWPARNDLSQDAAARKMLEQRIADHDIHLIHPLRPGKKLLVLDLDYTLFDMKGGAERLSDLCRPYLHEFLAAVFPFYDICVWSQTAWTWLEMKLTEMGMLTREDYYVSFVLDKNVMFSVVSKHKGEVRKHYVKPLEFIWRKVAGTSKQNTIHIDDLSRNFALNPRNGLKIHQWKYSTRAREQDIELRLLTRYLLLLKDEQDLTVPDHSEWKKYLKRQ